MRYFIISLFINIAILFIPLKSDEILSKKKEEKIETKVVLNLQKEEPKPILLPVEPQQILVEDIPKPVIKEEIKPVLPEVKKIEKPKEIKKIKPKKEVKKNKIQPVKEVEPTINEPVPVKQVAIDEPQATQHIAEASDNKESYCKENIGFKILKEPVPEYPKQALMLRLKETFYVEVDFKIINGVADIVSVRGKNKIFNNEAVRLTKDMKISVLKDIDHCVITKPYEFKPKD